MKKNIDENIVLDEQQKEDEQSKKKMPKDKVKRIVLAVFLLILAVAFVVLGAFCATGCIDKFSTSANVAYADTIVDVSDVYDYSFNGSAYLDRNSNGVTPDFNSFVISTDFYMFFGDEGYLFSCDRESVFSFYRCSDNRKVADILLTRPSELVGNLSLRIFADDKLSSYTTVKMFDFYATADDNGALTKLGVRTFTNSYCFGYGNDNRVYCKVSDSLTDDVTGTFLNFVYDITPCFWFYEDVINDYSQVCKNYLNLHDKYFDLYHANCISYIPYYPSTGTYGERVYIDTDYLDDKAFIWSFKSKVFPTDINADTIVEDDTADGEGIYFVSYEDLFRKCVKRYSRNQTWYYLDDDGYYHFEMIVYFVDHELYSKDNDNRFVLTDVILPYGTDLSWKYAYRQGSSVGYSQALNDTDTVVNGVIDVIESPVDLLKTVFNFEIFGINISSVIFFVISVVIVAFVIKKVV